MVPIINQPPENGKLLSQIFCDIMSGIGSFTGRYLFRCTGHYHGAAPVTAFRTHIDNIIRCLYHIQIMFDNDHSIAALRQTLQDLHQLVYIRKMQTCGRLIQNIHRLSGASLTQLRCQLNPLCLTAGQCGGRLPQTDIGQAYII